MLWLLPVFFLLAAASDWFTCQWLRARESNKLWLAVLLSMVLETLTWIPLWCALAYDQPAIAGACILGSAVGTGLGLRRGRK